MQSKKLLALALGLCMAESAIASPCKLPSSAASSIATTTLSESATTTLPVSSSTETSVLDTTLTTGQTSTATKPSETEIDTAITLTTHTTSVDTTTVEGQTTTLLLETTTNTGEATTTADEATTTTTEATTTAEAGCAQVTVLANPTSIFSSEGNRFDDEYKAVMLPFEVEVFGASSSIVYVSVNGLLTLDRGSYLTSVNTALPAESIPSVAIMPYWDDLYVTRDVCGIGITYEISETFQGRTFTVEYYVGGGDAVGEHFTVTMYENQPGLVRYVYYKTSGHGDRATVGVQNGMLKSQYSFNEADSIPDNSYIEIDTSSGDGVISGGQL